MICPGPSVWWRTTRGSGPSWCSAGVNHPAPAFDPPGVHVEMFMNERG